MLQPDRFRCFVGKETVRNAFGAHARLVFQQASEVHRNAPVVSCLTRRRHSRAHPRDAAFAVGDSAFFLAPGGGGQQQVGEGGGAGIGKGLLHHDKFGALQSTPHRGLVGHGLRGVGASDPQSLDLAVSGGLKHFHSGFARRGRHAGQAPQRCHFGAVRRVGQVAVGAQQIGESAHFPAAHGVGLAGQ